MGKEKKLNPTMAFGDSQLASAADSTKICSDGPGSAALVSRLSLMAIVGFKYFFFCQFWTYVKTKISKNQKHLFQNIFHITDRSVHWIHVSIAKKW